MKPTEFGYWLTGLMRDHGLSPGDRATAVLQKAREVLALAPAKAEPVGLTSLTVTEFCVHNVNVKEQCPACANFANPTWRVFAIRLPVGTRQVYIQRHDRTPGNPNAESGAEAAERATDA